MNKGSKENLTFGALILGLVAILGLLWLLKIILSVFLVVAESVVILGIYGVLIYFALAALCMLYDHFTKGRSPGFVRTILKFHYSTARSLQGLLNILKKKSN
ncbi:MAG: hypothetical protein MK132_12855 [Lentisphaerales bacterium]|nr:hypothetical protein [Lentisphaerales bacterium]